MSFGMQRSVYSTRFGNLTQRERWISTLVGLGLTLGAWPRGSFVRRVALSAGGMALIARGLAGYCGVKAAWTRQASLGEGMREQWQRLRARVRVGAGGIDSMETLYVEELQELASSAAQLEALTLDLEHGVSDVELLRKLRGYAAIIRSRRQDLERVLNTSGRRAYGHLDQAMQALAEETRKMARIRNSAVREAALVESLQRLLHYQIAACGSAAAHAEALGQQEAAAQLAEFCERDKAFDAELTDVAKVLNPRAASGRNRRATTEIRAD
jgi:ferritin-like metal-binding protein YciE